MTSFSDEYSDYYDLLYDNKNYAGEAAYVNRLIRNEGVSGNRLLEIGSGTGNYGAFLSSLGYSITAVEKSPSMGRIAQQKNISNYKVIISDVLDVNLEPESFGAVVAMFHVICYLTSDVDIKLCFDKIYIALLPGGVFIFDTWHTPAVLHQKPEVRSKIVENSAISLTRNATPICYDKQSLVEVNYDINGLRKNTGEKFSFSEKHLLRHFSIAQIKHFAEQAGFEHLRSEEFLTGNKPGSGTWGVCHILKKI